MKKLLLALTAALSLSSANLAHALQVLPGESGKKHVVRIPNSELTRIGIENGRMSGFRYKLDELDVVELELVEPLSPQPTAVETTASPPRVRPRITFDKRIATSYDDTLRKKNARPEILAPERFDHPAALEQNLAPARAPHDLFADAGRRRLTWCGRRSRRACGWPGRGPRSPRGRSCRPWRCPRPRRRRRRWRWRRSWPGGRRGGR